MKIKLLLALVLIGWQSQINAQLTVSFQSDSFSLTKDVTNQIDKILVDLKAEKEFVKEIILSGHTDIDGSELYNKELSAKRVKSVKQYLESKGFESEIFELEWHGENKPAASNVDEQSKKLNRRVEISFHYHPVLPQLNPRTKKTQYFTGNTKQDFEITGEEGTRIFIPADVLMFKDGSEAKGEMQIELKEFYKTSDIIKANLHTKSRDRLLETGGMIKLDVTVDGREVVIKEDKSVEVVMPAPDYKEEMNVFYGDIDERSVLDWREADEPSVEKTQYNYLSRTVKQRTMVPEQKVTVNRLGRQETETVYKFGPTEYGDTLSPGYSMQIKNDGFGYINCDRFVGEKGLTNMMVNVDAELKNTRVLLVFEEIKSIMPGYINIESGKYMFPNIPEGKKAKLVAFSKNENGYLFEVKDISVSKSQQLNPAHITEDQFKKGLALLDE